MKNIIRQFLRLEAAAGLILIVVTLFALMIANSPLQNVYHLFLDVPVSVKISSLDISKPLLLWINDGMMAIFFLVVGLEIKRELINGSLKGRDKALFPAIAALGGMLIPALIYLLFNGADETTRQGWAIPTATDIAFALGVMALLGSRVPGNLKVFLLALAIIDDLGAIIIIALFYTHQISLDALGVAAIAIALLAWLNWSGVSKTSAYLIIGLILWVSVLKSGVHATLSGVIVGLMIPLNTPKQKYSLSEELEQSLHPWVAYLILPLFAFANAGVSFEEVSLSGLASLLPSGIACGLFFGKPLGIFIFCWLAVKLGVAKLPDGINFKQIFAVAVLCGIGFTMSIFIASLAFERADEMLSTYSRLGVLVGSAAAAVTGFYLLSMVLPGRKKLPA